jgi:hypothetical protein
VLVAGKLGPACKRSTALHPSAAADHQQPVESPTAINQTATTVNNPFASLGMLLAQPDQRTQLSSLSRLSSLTSAYSTLGVEFGVRDAGKFEAINSPVQSSISQKNTCPYRPSLLLVSACRVPSNFVWSMSCSCSYRFSSSSPRGLLAKRSSMRSIHPRHPSVGAIWT